MLTKSYYEENYHEVLKFERYKSDSITGFIFYYSDQMTELAIFEKSGRCIEIDRENKTFTCLSCGFITKYGGDQMRIIIDGETEYRMIICKSV